MQGICGKGFELISGCNLNCKSLCKIDAIKCFFDNNFPTLD